MTLVLFALDRNDALIVPWWVYLLFLVVDALWIVPSIKRMF